MTTESHDKRINNIEKRITVIDERFTNVHNKIDEHRAANLLEMQKITASLESIKDGQHSQALLNQKMDWTLTTINDEREREREAKIKTETNTKRDMKAIRNMVLGMILTIVGTLLLTLIRMWLGI